MTDYTPPVPEAPRFSIGNVVSQTFSICFRNFVPFFLLAFVVNLPALLIQLAAPDRSGNPSIEFSFMEWLGSMVGGLLNLIVTGAILYGVYQQMRGQPFTIGRSLQIAGGRLLPIIGVSILTGFLVFVGFLLLVVPGVIIALMFMIAVPVTVVERLGPADAMSRSKDLTAGHRLELFGLAVMYAILMWLITMVSGVVIGMGMGFDSGPISAVVWQLFSVAVGLIQSVGLGVIYYELRRSKEGLDLNDLASVFE